MQSSAANEHLQICNPHRCNSAVFAEPQQCQLLAQTEFDSLPVLGAGSIVQRYSTVDQGLGVSFVPTVSCDNVLSLNNPQLFYTRQAESTPAPAI